MKRTILAMLLAAGLTYWLALPAPTLPTIVRVTMCEPERTVGYVYVQKDGTISSIDAPLSEEAAKAVTLLQERTALRVGMLHFQSRTACPGA